MRSAIRVEWQKMRRSTVVLTATILMAGLLPLMGLAFYSLGHGGGAGLVADKAAAFVVGEGWVGYFGAINQIAAVAVFLGAGIVAAWVFGREHADRTFASLFALPVSRRSVAGAKLTVLLFWVTALTVLIGFSSLGLGLAAGVGDSTGGLAVELLKVLSVTYAAGLLSLTMALVASVGRGYLPAVGAIVLIIATAQVAVLFGTGGWFPFAVPGLIAVSGAEGAPSLGAIQIGLVPLTTGLGAWLTLLWWQRAEVV
jgi:ABC-2 type transport system permease protein